MFCVEALALFFRIKTSGWKIKGHWKELPNADRNELYAWPNIVRVTNKEE
jgi:hypothetical protein